MQYGLRLYSNAHFQPCCFTICDQLAWICVAAEDNCYSLCCEFLAIDSFILDYLDNCWCCHTKKLDFRRSKWNSWFEPSSVACAYGSTITVIRESDPHKDPCNNTLPQYRSEISATDLFFRPTLTEFPLWIAFYSNTGHTFTQFYLDLDYYKAIQCNYPTVCIGWRLITIICFK